MRSQTFFYGATDKCNIPYTFYFFGGGGYRYVIRYKVIKVICVGVPTWHAGNKRMQGAPYMWLDSGKLICFDISGFAPNRQIRERCAGKNQGLTNVDWGILLSVSLKNSSKMKPSKRFLSHFKLVPWMHGLCSWALCLGCRVSARYEGTWGNGANIAATYEHKQKLLELNLVQMGRGVLFQLSL